mmetsp:Transcript_116737/g.337188  ORF Transcript_116737/g.337188 Transcript_116737/m.337188 type:complete len:388 (-) Transcript_116737:1633-2796(-)
MWPYRTHRHRLRCGCQRRLHRLEALVAGRRRLRLRQPGLPGRGARGLVERGPRRREPGLRLAGGLRDHRGAEQAPREGPGGKRPSLLVALVQRRRRVEGSALRVRARRLPPRLRRGRADMPHVHHSLDLERHVRRPPRLLDRRCLRPPGGRARIPLHHTHQAADRCDVDGQDVGVGLRQRTRRGPRPRHLRLGGQGRVPGHRGRGQARHSPGRLEALLRVRRLRRRPSGGGRHAVAGAASLAEEPIGHHEVHAVDPLRAARERLAVQRDFAGWVADASECLRHARHPAARDCPAQRRHLRHGWPGRRRARQASRAAESHALGPRRGETLGPQAGLHQGDEVVVEVAAPVRFDRDGCRHLEEERADVGHGADGPRIVVRLAAQRDSGD